MKTTFVDTYYYLALLNPRDSAHVAAVEVGSTISGRLVTTQYVLTEVADALSSSKERSKFAMLMAVLESAEHVLIIPGDDELFQRGVEHYRSRPDKDWSLTDCLSFVVMREHGITEALTADRHFAQAGFAPILAET